MGIWWEDLGRQRDEQTLIAARNAPASVRASIDAARHRQGLPMLWPEVCRAVQTRQRAERMLDDGMGYLIAPCTPGVSVPLACGLDERALPEVFEPGAFRHSVRDINARKAEAWLSVGHGDGEIASTRDGSLRLWVDDECGLMMEVSLLSTPEHRQLAADARCGRVGVSVGFTPSRMQTRVIGRRRHRVICEARLSHVALIVDGSGAEPAYRAARAIHVWGRDAVARQAAASRAALAAWMRDREAKRR